MKKINIILIIVAFLMITGCADQVTFTAAQNMEPVGFWYGVWHGAILGFAWIVSLFNSDVAIYAIYNNGGWYNFGYIVGIVCFGLGVKSTSDN